MAGDWLKIEAATPDKPEVFEIASLCKIAPSDAFGRLFLVWRLFDQHTESGNARNVTWAYLDHVAGVSGFAQAMHAVGWLEGGGDGSAGVTLPNFARHNGNTAKSRALTARRVATHKKRNANDAVTVSALPREEKRRYKTIGGNAAEESQNLGRYWELDDAGLVAKAKSIGVNTLGESRPQILASIRAHLEKKKAA